MKRLTSIILMLALCVSLFCVFATSASASPLHTGGRLWWKFDGETYTFAAVSNDVILDIPLYVTEYNGGITIFVDADDVPAGSSPKFCIFAGDVLKMDFDTIRVDDNFGGYKSYYFHTFTDQTVWFGLPFTCLYDLKEALISSKSTLYYIEDIELNSWQDAVDFFSLDYPEPPGPGEYIPTEWYDILLKWVFDLWDGLVGIFNGVFALFDVPFSAVGDFFEALTNGEDGVFAWLYDTTFYSQLVLFFGFFGNMLAVLPVPILNIMKFAVGVGLAFAILKIVSR